MSLPQELRLRRGQDFDRMRREGVAYRHRLLLLSVLPNDTDHNRYGFVTGKKVGKAVQRNRVRRLVKESIRLVHPQLRPGFDVVIVAQPGAAGQPLSVIQRTIQELLAQAGLLSL